MLCFHGTTADNLPSILANGLKCDTDKVWNCSRDKIYFWGKNFIDRGCDGEFDRERLISQAFDSASCGLAAAKDCRAVIIIFELDESEHEDDNSCDNMQEANCVGRDIKPEEIKEILISNDLSLIRGYFIYCMMNRDLYNLEFSRLEEKIGRAFGNMELIDELYEIVEWENVPLPANV